MASPPLIFNTKPCSTQCRRAFLFPTIYTVHTIHCFAEKLDKKTLKSLHNSASYINFASLFEKRHLFASRNATVRDVAQSG